MSATSKDALRSSAGSRRAAQQASSGTACCPRWCRTGLRYRSDSYRSQRCRLPRRTLSDRALVAVAQLNRHRVEQRAVHDGVEPAFATGRIAIEVSDVGYLEGRSQIERW